MKDFKSPQQRYEERPAWPQQQQTGAWGSFEQVTAAEAAPSERMAFVRKVYALFFAGILFGIAGVGLGLSFPPLLQFAFEHPFIMLFVMIGGVFGAQAVRHVRGVNVLALFGFTTLTGVVISPLISLLRESNPNSIWAAGVLTVGIFGGLTAYVFISKRDFSFMRGMLTVGLIVVVLSAVVNIFIGASAFGFAIAAASLLLFSGFVLYDTSEIIRRYPTNEYIAGALSLYLDAFNIFLALLRLLNAGGRD